MKIKIDNEEVLELSETQKKVIQSDISEDIFDKDMKRRVHYILTHKYERCLERLKSTWIPKLKNKMSSIPTNDEKLAELIMSQPEYKSKKQKEDQEKAAKANK